MKPTRRHQFSVRNRAVLMNVQSPHKWWSTLKSAVFGTSSSLPPLVALLVRLICCQIILRTSSPGRLLICRSLVIRLLPSLTTFAFGSREVRCLLLDLHPYGGTDPLGMFPLFLKRTSDVMELCLSVVFRRLVRLNSFLPCWRQANVTACAIRVAIFSIASFSLAFNETSIFELME